MGQGALILGTPEAVDNPFFMLVPHWSRVPMVLLATVATVIASQAVISGAFSVTRQAAQLAVDLTFFAANLTKVHHGGWFPLVVGVIAFVILTTWQRGRVIVTQKR